jgi:hypothetical protein
MVDEGGKVWGDEAYCPPRKVRHLIEWGERLRTGGRRLKADWRQSAGLILPGGVNAEGTEVHGRAEVRDRAGPGVRQARIIGQRVQQQQERRGKDVVCGSSVYRPWLRWFPVREREPLLRFPVLPTLDSIPGMADTQLGLAKGSAATLKT